MNSDRRVATVRCPRCRKLVAEWWVVDGELRELRSASDRRALADRPKPTVGALARLTWQWQSEPTRGPLWCAESADHRWTYDGRYRRSLQSAVANGRCITLNAQRVS
jgi:hypothetical protein